MQHIQYNDNLQYLEFLLASERVLLNRLALPSRFFAAGSTTAELKLIQENIAYLKETQPELFL